jgi:hypothetical protein
MGHSADEDTNQNGFESSEFRIGNPTAEDRDNIGQEQEHKAYGHSELDTASQSACCLLCAWRGSTSAIATLSENQ